MKTSIVVSLVKTRNNRHQSDSQCGAIFALLAAAQTLTQKWLRTGCSCAGRYAHRRLDMKVARYVFSLTLLLGTNCFASTYTAKISQIQAEGIGDTYNTLYLAYDVNDSPCSSSNAVNRFTIVNNAQQSVALAALMADKIVTVQTNGTCTGNVEAINYIIIKRVD